MKSIRLTALLLFGAVLIGTMSCGDGKSSTDKTNDYTPVGVKKKCDAPHQNKTGDFEFSPDHSYYLFPWVRVASRIRNRIWQHFINEATVEVMNAVTCKEY